MQNFRWKPPDFTAGQGNYAFAAVFFREKDLLQWDYYCLHDNNKFGSGNCEKKMLTEQHLRSILQINTLIVKTI